MPYQVQVSSGCQHIPEHVKKSCGFIHDDIHIQCKSFCCCCWAKEENESESKNDARNNKNNANS